ncbi:MAG: hypothetical protein LH472_15725, partial [Pyrinomonadaceae bacterium]|nr:hypothetical protein [Pyrinomonadaceae bacterium]
MYNFSETYFNVKKFSLSAYNLPTKIFWLILLVANLVIGGWTLYAAFSFSVSQIAVLLVALAVSALVNQHELTIPQTKKTLNAGDFIVLAGILLLGTSGGVLLAASVSAVYYKRAPAADKSRWMFNSFINLISAFAAGIIFCLILEKAAGFTGNFVDVETVPFGWLALAAVLTASAYRLASTTLNLIFDKLKSGSAEISELPKIKFSRLWESSALGLISALVLHILLQEFGLSFGFVVLLVTVVGHYAYLIHNSRLAQKTKEITEACRIHLATVEALATAIDARDQIGSGHVRRTQIYAVGIGKILDLSADELQALHI